MNQDGRHPSDQGQPEREKLTRDLGQQAGDAAKADGSQEPKDSPTRPPAKPPPPTPSPPPPPPPPSHESLSGLVAAYLRRLESGEDYEHVCADCRREHPRHADKIMEAIRLERDFQAENAPAPPPSQIGEFRIIEEIARGGMGVVYRAFHERLEREVAIKTLKKKTARTRFLNERQILAQFHQTNIVAIHEAGEDDGEPYIVMPYIHGATLAQIVRTATELRNTPTRSGATASTLSDLAALARRPRSESPTTPRRRTSKRVARPFRFPNDYYRSVAACVVDLAQAIAACHRKNIVHRDLKPDNVMVDQEGRSWIIDFGIATKLNGQPQPDSSDKPENQSSPHAFPSINSESVPRLVTASGVAGTPAYMAPEQLEERYSKSTDIWGLGTILYELLAFRRAIDAPPTMSGSSPLAGHVAVRQRLATSPRRHNRDVPRDLEAICLKCLQPQPERRYSSVSKLVDDLEHWLNDEPVSARRAAVWEHAYKWARRRRAAATALISFLVLLVAVAVGLFFHSQRIGESLAETQQRERAIRRHTYALKMSAGYRAWQHAKLDHVARILKEEAVPLNDGSALIGWEWYLLNGACQSEQASLAGHTSAIRSVIYAPSGDRLFSADAAGNIKVWDRATLSCVKTIAAHRGAINEMLISSDAATVVTVSDDTLVRSWTLPQWQAKHTNDGHVMPIPAAAQHPTTPLVATAGADATIQVWDPVNGERGAMFQADGALRDVAFSPDGQLLAGLSDRSLIVWQLVTGRPLYRTSAIGSADELAFTPDGRSIVLKVGSDKLHFFNPTDGQVQTEWKMDAPFSEFQFAPDGQRLFAASRGGAAVFESTGQRLLRTLRGHRAGVTCLALRPGSEKGEFATGSGDKTVKIWNADFGRGVRVLGGHPVRVHSLCFGPQGKLLASGGIDQAVKVWDTETGELIFQHPQQKINRNAQGAVRSIENYGEGHGGIVSEVAFSHDGAWLASAGFDLTARIWNVRTGSEVAVLRHPGQVTSVKFSHDGKLLATGCWDEKVRIYRFHDPLQQPPTPQWVLRGHTDYVVGISFSPDTSKLASASWDETIKIWNTADGKEIRTLTGHGTEVRTVAFGPQGKLLASGDSSGIIKIWNVDSGRCLANLRGHVSAIDGLCFNQQGTRLASVSSYSEKTVRIWDVASGEQTAEFEGRGAAAFSPDGWKLAFCSQRYAIEVWDARYGKEQCDRLPVDDELAAAAAPAVQPEVHLPQGDPPQLEMKCLGYALTKELADMRSDDGATVTAAEDKQFLLAVVSAPHRVFFPDDREFELLVREERQTGNMLPARERMALYVASYMTANYRDGTARTAKFLGGWPARSGHDGFNSTLTMTSSRRIEPEQRVCLAFAFEVDDPWNEEFPMLRYKRQASLRLAPAELHYAAKRDD